MNNANDQQAEQILALFPRSQVWDQDTQKTVDTMRLHLHRRPQPTITYIQENSRLHRPVRAGLRTEREFVHPPVEDDIRQMLFACIREMGEISYEEPDLAAVPVEGIQRDEHEHEHEQEANKLVVFHVHGGSFFQGSPQAYRPTTTKLAALTGGRVMSVDYRLAPQNPFPAALLDILRVYLSLIRPGAEETKKVDPKNIVFAGDSSGGMLLCSLLQILLHTAHYQSVKFQHEVIEFPLPLPAGLAVISLPGDLLQALPSHRYNLVNDLYLNIPWSFPSYPSCALWPRSPPRSQIYGDLDIHAHPLVSPATAQSWAGAPPLWISMGEEQYLDGGKAVARRAASQGVGVTWTVYEAMPHCFSMLPKLSQSAQAEMLMMKWGQFCRDCVERSEDLKGRVSAVKVDFRSATEMQIPFEDPSDLPLHEIERCIMEKNGELKQEFRKAWKLQGHSVL